MSDLYIGLMSGTSLDGVDGVLANFASGEIHVVQHVAEPFPQDLRRELLSLNQQGDNELHRAALAGNGLARIYAKVVEALMQRSGVSKSQIRAIGAHGQTVRHRPGEFDGDTVVGRPATGYTIQLNNPALLAELTGIDVVADFRTRDVAAGGQGAPLVPAFHREIFGIIGKTVQVLNIGGIANLTVLASDGTVIGFDCGPGNALMDAWCLEHTGQSFDKDGTWAASGTVDNGLLESLLTEPYLAKNPPKSTGRDLFNVNWMKPHLAPWTRIAPHDVQATLTEFTAITSARCVLQYAEDVSAEGMHRQQKPGSSPLIVCGGGAKNRELMRRLQKNLSGYTVSTSDDYGLPALEVEAAAFAWLARKAVRRETGSLESVTGAHGARILGAIYPA